MIDLNRLDDIDPTADDFRIRSVPWDRFTDELLELYRPPLRSPSTYRQMKHMLDLVGKSGVEATGDMTIQTIARLVASMPPELSPHTVLTMLRCIRTTCSVAVKSGYLRVNPFSIRPIGKWVRLTPPKGRRSLTRAQTRALLDTLKAETEDGRVGWRLWKARRLYTMVATVAMTGLRAGELLHLHRVDVDIPRRIIRVVSRKEHGLKTDRSEQPVPFPEALVPILEEWDGHRLDPPVFPAADRIPWMWPGCRGRCPWVNGNEGDKPLGQLKAAARRAGVANVTWQAIRRSLAVRLEAHGAGSATISRILRHSEEVDAKWYREADEDDLRDLVKDLEF